MASPRHPACPRCGYDLTGAVESWTDSWPLEGVCSECGLTLAWGRVLGADRYLIPWFIEHTQGRWATFLAAWRTWCRVVYPPGFFAALSIEHPMRPGRFFLWLAILLLPSLALAAVVHVAVVALYVIPFLPAPFLPAKGMWYANAIARPFMTFDFQIGPGGTIAGWTMSPLFHTWLWQLFPVWFLVLAWPAVLFILPTTRSRAKVRPIHLARAFVYSLWWVVIPALVRLGNGLYLLLATTPSPRGALELVDGPGRWISVFQTPPGALVWFGALTVWTGWWWYIAIVRHMRLQHARRVWAVALVITLLSTGTIPMAVVLFVLR